MPNENQGLGWKVAFALFGVIQLLGLFLMGMIFNQISAVAKQGN